MSVWCCSPQKPILDAALGEYEKSTGNKLLDHPLAIELQHCDTVDTTLAILEDQAKAFQQFKNGDQSLMKWIDPLTRVLFGVCGTLSEGDQVLLRIPIRRDSGRA